MDSSFRTGEEMLLFVYGWCTPPRLCCRILGQSTPALETSKPKQASRWNMIRPEEQVCAPAL